jgi:glycosyltransferase involved in cell wall biosynthesis
MKILINTSNLKKGGGLQVAHSFISEIKNNKRHTFNIVLSEEMGKIINSEEFNKNFTFHYYTIYPKFISVILGKDTFLDRLEAKVGPDVVFSVFGPTYWKPKAKHVVGFAKPQYIYKDSPFFKYLSLKHWIKLKITEKLHLYNFNHFCDEIITETEDVTQRLGELLPNKTIHTVTNYFNQIFTDVNMWSKEPLLSKFNGITFLSIAANYPHKNLQIIPKVITYLINKYPTFKFRFVLTITSKELVVNNQEIKNRIVFLGPVSISQCPSLYHQTDIMFLPTLLECFSASYPEAMYMQAPILTSDLSFAKGLCGNAALYFDPLSEKEISRLMVSISKDLEKQKELKNNGVIRLKNFDTAKERAQKYLKIIENL